MPFVPRTYSADWRKPTSISFWGDSPGDQARLAWAVARKINPDVLWLQIEDSREEEDPVERSVLNEVNHDLLWSVTPSDFAPLPDYHQIATWFYREDLDADTRLHALTDYLRLPTFARRLIDDWSAHEATRALVIGRGSRLRSLYEPEVRGIRPFLEAMNQYSTTPIILFPSTSPPKNGKDVDYLLHVEAGGEGVTRPSRVECQIGAPPEASGLFPSGRHWDVDVLLRELEGT